MTNEQLVQHLQARLKELDDERASVKAQLDAIMREHIAVDVAEKSNEHMVGDAHLFSKMPKARLLEIIEQHWRIHHNAMPRELLEATKEFLVNYLLDIKGLPGHYNKPEPKAKGEGSERRRLSSIAF